MGMPGAGKSEAAEFFSKKEIPIVRFGDLTDEVVKGKGLPFTPDNERLVREELRKELGMAAYAIKAKPKIEAQLENHTTVVLDGLYSWEEYILLKKCFPNLLLLHIYANPKLRYSRLSKRRIRPLSPEQARKRDVFELENLNKGGPIAIADHLIKNETSVEDLHRQLDDFLKNVST